VAWIALVNEPEDESDWCLLRLIEAIDSDAGWSDLIEATDINEDGWIVGYGLHDEDPGPTEDLQERAYLLIPAPQPCVGDTNNDGVVDVDDLVNVLLDWGTNGTGHNGDVDGSGMVKPLDIIAVLINWGLCPGSSGSVLSLEDELEGAALDWPEDWDQFMANIGEENYRC
jgi:hypothetical protein